MPVGEREKRDGVLSRRRRRAAELSKLKKELFRYTLNRGIVYSSIAKKEKGLWMSGSSLDSNGNPIDNDTPAQKAIKLLKKVSDVELAEIHAEVTEQTSPQIIILHPGHIYIVKTHMGHRMSYWLNTLDGKMFFMLKFR